MLRLSRFCSLAGAAAILCGCANQPAAPTAPAAPAPVSADQAGLKEGIALFESGQFAEAIKRLSAPDVAAGPKATQLAALKYTAFSYCVTNRAVQCRQQFDKAFRLDPAFDLGPAEHGHPLWDPVFVRAQKASAAHGAQPKKKAG